MPTKSFDDVSNLSFDDAREYLHTHKTPLPPAFQQYHRANDAGWQVWHEAAILNLLPKEVDWTARSGYTGDTPLHILAKHGHPIPEGIKPEFWEIPNNDGEKAAIIAAQNGNLPKNHGCHHIVDKNGDSVAHILAAKGRLEQDFYDPNLLNSKGYTTDHVLAQYGHIKAGFTRYGLADKHGNTVGHIMALNGHPLPDDYNDWGRKNLDRDSVACYAAEHGVLPKNFTEWHHTDRYGRSVAHIKTGESLDFKLQDVVLKHRLVPSDFIAADAARLNFDGLMEPWRAAAAINEIFNQRVHGNPVNIRAIQHSAITIKSWDELPDTLVCKEARRNFDDLGRSMADFAQNMTRSGTVITSKELIDLTFSVNGFTNEYGLIPGDYISRQTGGHFSVRGGSVTFPPSACKTDLEAAAILINRSGIRDVRISENSGHFWTAAESLGKFGITVNGEPFRGHKGDELPDLNVVINLGGTSNDGNDDCRGGGGRGSRS